MTMLAKRTGSYLADRLDIAAIEARHPEAMRGNARGTAIGIAITALLVGFSGFAVWWLEISPIKLITGFGEFLRLVALMFPPAAGTWSRFWLFCHSMGQTLGMAFMGTLIAAIIAFPLGFLAARNVLPTLVLHILFRRSLDVVRSIDTFIWALIWTGVVGLGPFAGVLAIACSNIGALAKLFSEAIETADGKAVEGVVASGGGPLQRIRFGMLPQVLPVILSQVLYFFESNTRDATIIGIVGAGGIGLHLTEAIRTLEWNQVSLLILMVLIVVAIIDFISGRIRAAIIGRRPAAG